ncbi:hypothetical protein [Endozoicomonas sp. ALC020]|uniref:hypothetical protein n=1 Tax=unclassified Endozoicomonas TaxID=2644528 RepID=UPI003BB2134E
MDYLLNIQVRKVKEVIMMGILNNESLRNVKTKLMTASTTSKPANLIFPASHRL